MADWSLPALTSTYSDVLTILKARDVDALSLCYSAPTNPPTGAIKYLRASNKFQEYDGAAWNDKVIAVAGGGTGAATAADARTNLGLGTIATQNSNSVTITGGTVTGISLAASTITSGEVALARGGTGASLALGVSGTYLRSNGSAVAFSTIAETDIVDGSLLARVGSTETIVGAWTFSTGPVISGNANFTASVKLNGSHGTSGQVFKSNGSGAAPSWGSAAVISQVQHISVTHAESGGNPQTHVISVTDYTKTAVVYGPNLQGVQAYLTSNINLNTYGSDSTASTLYIDLVEFL